MVTLTHFYIHKMAFGKLSLKNMGLVMDQTEKSARRNSEESATLLKKIKKGKNCKKIVFKKV